MRATTFEGVSQDLTQRLERLLALPAGQYRPGNSAAEQLGEWFALQVAPKDVYNPWRFASAGPNADLDKLALLTSPQGLADLAELLLKEAERFDSEPKWQSMVHPFFMAPDLCRSTAATLCKTAEELSARMSISPPSRW